MKSRYSILSLALTLLICFQVSAKDKWVRVQSSHFTLIGNASESDIRKVAIKLEQFRGTLSIVFPKLRIHTEKPTTVIIFKSNDAFKPYKPRYKGKIVEQVAGYFRERVDGNYIVLSSEDVGLNPYQIIFHEYEHFVIHNNLFRLPVWLDEGLAEFYSSFEITPQEEKATLGSPIARHVYNLRDSTMLPLKTLLTVDRKSPYYNESSKSSVFYSQSWALVHYLMLGNKQKRQSQLIKFIDLVQDDVPTEQAFQQAFQADYKVIEEELRPYINRTLYPIVNVMLQNQLSLDKELQVSVLNDAEVEYYLGDLLLNTSQLEDAESHFQKSLTLDPKFAPSRVSLGVLRLRQGKVADARQNFETAIELDAKNYLAHYFYAETLSIDQKPVEAIKQYEEAIRLNPRAGFSYLQLGYKYREIGEDQKAIETFGQGVGVDSRNPDFYRTLAFTFLQRANGKTAVYNAENYLRIDGWQEDSSQYLVLTKYFGLRQMAKNAEAAKFLDEADAKVDSAEWPYPVIKYLRHALTLDELLKLATDNDKLTEAHAYAGLELSLNGDRAAALQHLEWVKENGNKRFVEYPLALAEIDRLKAPASQ